MQANLFLPAANRVPEACADLPQGTVLSCVGDRITLAIDSGCARCAHGCGIGKLAAGRRTQIELAKPETPAFAHLRAGDRVYLAAPPNALAAAALGYLFPALALLLGAGLGQGAGGDLFAALGAGAGFALALLLTRLFSARHFSALIRIESAFSSPTEPHHEH